jgi:hypothetical protein
MPLPSSLALVAFLLFCSLWRACVTQHTGTKAGKTCKQYEIICYAKAVRISSRTRTTNTRSLSKHSPPGLSGKNSRPLLTEPTQFAGSDAAQNFLHANQTDPGASITDRCWDPLWQINWVSENRKGDNRRDKSSRRLS